MSLHTPRLVASRITHVRTEPVENRFVYRSMHWLVDIDALPDLGVGRRWLARFCAADHFAQPVTDGQTLRDRLTGFLAAEGIQAPTGRVIVLTSPRVAGYVFNPLSVFWCHHADGTLACVVAEVHNTYSQRHCYVVHPDADGRASVPKEFYVSPFNDVDGSYRLRLPTPDEDGRVSLGITLHRPDDAPFIATLVGRSRPATPRAVLRAQLSAPLAPWMVAARIRVQGIALWMRGLPIVPRPAPEKTCNRKALR
ncbi:DUF1365 domain-containing protein [Gordonia sp. HY285]|uniref:DUF1365 domain-containing protein n=1 Tax=Gordonia liuliyuniae TaxID=2911517 RepID=UPI001F26BF4F|nr:DUF1365 domain-containing protein [Gordonia liuliyuniae]MCF8612088.1 DUF1365 domain-containing protein [Gordonia liuliyuniae]